ncbi:SusD/RagB family nutrient-binding outer membrane lipoprotein [Mariniflexile sp. AS56]|uniref:SusD/RagB family nutrient-binding outer membrane lipoprotein n=1 Tax=Mariniflexile sp. AS56 TaxID=3063957 RepID=UPI0026EEE21F|nr:SusD/RagB family nutrient-binding outer membrane lipoprotein [Mariniflexile sp. AS56]MDO7170750.1 SusD/RagB family nutrient-binding outer membrane lipoprotein [Mariniflexile sp. AS56]
MKTIKMKKAILFLFALALISVSCDEFLDVNDNPNNPSISTPSLTLPVALENFSALNARTMTYLGNFLVVNWATPSNWSANSIYSRYDFSADDFSNIFETSYVSIFKDLTYIESYEDPTGAIDYSNYKAISKIVKGFQYQLLVDIYGDVPYSEANLRGDNTTPKYDDAETIYKAVIEDLAVAVDLIQNAPDAAENPGTQDTFFYGDMDHWVEFANTIKLRMLVRLSNTGQTPYIASEIAEIDANGGGYITTAVTSNPGYTNSTDKQSPFWDYFVLPVTGIQQNRGDYTVASEYAMNFLTNSNDPRRDRLYKPAATGGAYKGAVQSTVLPGTGFTSNDLSKVGPGLLISADQDQIVMSMAESLFIQAEATTRGYLAGGDIAAQALYEDAIEASFTQLAVPNAATEAQTYYGQDLVNISWSSSPNKIAAIMTQKWVALNGTSSIESWIDLTRTGFPANLPIPAESAGSRPVRLLYPASEVSRNINNVPTQGVNDVFTKNPFWK